MMINPGKYAHTSTFIRWIVWIGVSLLLTLVVLVLFQPVPTSTAGLKLFQALQTGATFLIPPLIVAYLWSEHPLLWLGWRQPMAGRDVLWACVMMVLALPGINLLGHCNEQMQLPECLSGLEAYMQQMEDAAMALTERFLCVQGVGALAINIVVMAILPAFAEELTFRGVLNNLFQSDRFAEGVKTASLKEYGSRAHMAIWLTAIIFSAIHMQFYGFVPRMLLGAWFGYMLLWTGSLWIPILMHAVNNSVAVVAYYIVFSQQLNPDAVEALGTGETLWLGIASLALTAVGIYFFRRSRTMSSASSRIS